jgi:pilus assembly protein CpaE
MRTLIVAASPHESAVRKLDTALRALGEGEESIVASYQNAESYSQQSQPEVVFACLGSNPRLNMELLPELRSIVSGSLLAVGQASDPKMILRTLQLGADLFLDEEDLESELEMGLSRVRGKSASGSGVGDLLAFLSASGGCGASTLAVNLASSLPREKSECLLVDLNSDRGDLAALLALKPQYTLVDACAHENRLDQAMFTKMISRHPSGIGLLAAPLHFTDARAVTPRGVAQAIALARKLFPTVIVDLEDCFHEEQTVVLQQATRILLVCRLDFTSLRNTRRILDALGNLAIPRDRVKVVANHHGQPNELPVAEAETALEEKIFCFIPSDPKAVNLANNLGLPVVLKEPASKVAQAILHFEKSLLEKERKPASLFRKFLGR